MSEQLKESLSAVMDGEADAFELRRVLDEAKVNDEMRAQWRRYHVLRDYMQHESHQAKPSLRDAIWAELSEGDADVAIDVAESSGLQSDASQGSKRAPWLGRITGMAVAASVAMLVVINGGVFEQDGQLGGDIAGVNSNAVLPVDTDSSHLVQVVRDVPNASDLQRQNAYMLYHIQRQAMNQPSMASFAKVLTYTDHEDDMPVADAAAAAEDTEVESNRE